MPSFELREPFARWLSDAHKSVLDAQAKKVSEVVYATLETRKRKPVKNDPKFLRERPSVQSMLLRDAAHIPADASVDYLDGCLSITTKNGVTTVHPYLKDVLEEAALWTYVRDFPVDEVFDISAAAADSLSLRIAEAASVARTAAEARDLFLRKRDLDAKLRAVRLGKRAPAGSADTFETKVNLSSKLPAWAQYFGTPCVSPEALASAALGEPGAPLTELATGADLSRQRALLGKWFPDAPELISAKAILLHPVFTFFVSSFDPFTATSLQTPEGLALFLFKGRNARALSARLEHGKDEAEIPRSSGAVSLAVRAAVKRFVEANPDVPNDDRALAPAPVEPQILAMPAGRKGPALPHISKALLASLPEEWRASAERVISEAVAFFPDEWLASLPFLEIRDGKFDFRSPGLRAEIESRASSYRARAAGYSSQALNRRNFLDVVCEGSTLPPSVTLDDLVIASVVPKWADVVSTKLAVAMLACARTKKGGLAAFLEELKKRGVACGAREAETELKQLGYSPKDKYFPVATLAFLVSRRRLRPEPAPATPQALPVPKS